MISGLGSPLAFDSCCSFCLELVAVAIAEFEYRCVCLRAGRQTIARMECRFLPDSRNFCLKLGMTGLKSGIEKETDQHCRGI